MDWTSVIVDLGGKVLPWALTALAGVLIKYAYSKVKSDYWRGVLTTATNEIFDAVRETHQTYVDEIKKGREDGKLTDEEKATAKDKALATAKSNIGSKGFARLARIFGGEKAAIAWMGTKVEASVAATKADPK